MIAVRIHGLAWKIETSEVSDFFQEYNPVPDSVIIGKGEDGRNNGLGAIAFESQDDADKAVEALQK